MAKLKAPLKRERIVKEYLDIDYREPLLELVADPATKGADRTIALDAIVLNDWIPTGQDLRVWWDSGIPALKKKAARWCERDNADIIEGILSEPDNKYFVDAIFALEFGFIEVEWKPVAIKALSHPDPKVRRQAAYTLTADEPNEACNALIKALSDSDTAVATEAANVLQYFFRRTVTRKLFAVAQDKSAPSKLRKQAKKSLDEQQDNVRHYLKYAKTDETHANIVKWVTPIQHELGFDKGFPEREEGSDPKPRKLKPAPKNLIELLESASTKKIVKAEVFYGMDWSVFPEKKRKKAIKLITNHPDPVVRAGFTSALGQWDAVPELIEMLDDEFFGPRKMARYWLGHTRTKSAALAKRILNELSKDSFRGNEAYEAVEAYLHHRNKPRGNDPLDKIVKETPIEMVRLAAVYHHPEPRRYGYLIDEPPLTTWAVHQRLIRLHAKEPFISDKRLRELRRIDHFYVAAALATIPKKTHRRA